MMRRVRYRLAPLALAAVVLTGGGCAGILRSYDIAPGGLRADEDVLRRMLAAGQAGSAFDRVREDAPDDEMLHALYHGVLAFHAGDYAESARVLDIASHIADERMTKSLSRSAFSLITNDLVLPYEPAPTERLMIPYYAALARLRMGDRDGAAVEARRLSLLLQRFDDDAGRVDPALRGTFRYIAGAIFEAVGEYGDADVAYRNAFSVDSTLPHLTDTDSLGTVLVVLEQGFVAHRAEQGLAVLLLPEEVEAIAHGKAEDRAAVSLFVASRIIDYAALDAAYGRSNAPTLLHVPAPERSVVPRTRKRTVCTDAAAAGATDSVATGARRVANRECTEKDEEIGGLPYLLKVAWPVLRASHRMQPAHMVVEEQSIEFAGVTDLSRGVVHDFERERALIVARTIARGTAKLALTKGAERKLEEKNEAAGTLVGLLGNISNVLTERADTRSWHLLPAGVSVARVALPPGDHVLTLTVGGREIVAPRVEVSAGRLAVLAVRAW
jgi:uncharacterized protein